MRVVCGLGAPIVVRVDTGAEDADASLGIVVGDAVVRVVVVAAVAAVAVPVVGQAGGVMVAEESQAL